MTKKNKISIYGASGHTKVIIDCIQSNPSCELAYLFDDDISLENLQAKTISIATPERLREYPILIGIGKNKIRKKIAEKLTSPIAGAVVHHNAITSPSCKINQGSVVMPGAIINADAKIGKHAIINTGAIIEHDCKIGDYAHISPNAALAGNVSVGEGTQIGIGAQVIQGIRIGKWCTIGAGAVIIKDIPDGATVVGNPGRVIK
ncbi:acetyltransferase [Mesonia aquimarina]|uniref:acetyltransferase n=1 Tax=Mesonia aquimarina TaxID=1504967 RepID=UPI000EF58EC4|nr:acetyltransferase [Mesonia aquimarina]